MSQSEPSLPQTTQDNPSHKTDAAATQPGEAAKRGGATRLPLVFALLALGISIGLAVAGYFVWDRFQQLDSEQAGIEPRLEQKVQPLQNRLQAISNDWRAGRRDIEQRLGALDSGQRAIRERVDRLASLVGRSELGWTLAEVEYLLRIASESLQLRRDKQTAVAALKSADARLRELADPQMLPVREQLARELNALREVPDVDVDGISLRLADSLQQVGALPVSGSQYAPPAAETTGFDRTRTVGSWKELPHAIWSALTELFRIREHDKPVGPMLPPERVWFLKENLRLQLAAARLALLREDSKAYRQALLTAAGWLGEWFDTEDLAVSAMQTGLEELAAVDIRPDLPDVSGALRVLRQLKQQQEKLAAPAVADEAQQPGAADGAQADTETVSPSPEAAPAAGQGDAP